MTVAVDRSRNDAYDSGMGTQRGQSESIPDAPPTRTFDPNRFAPPPPFNVPIERTLTGRTIAGVERFDIDGEGPRQAAFEQTVGPKTPNGATITHVLVQLARDPHDPDHRDAVAAYVGPYHVGYIPHAIERDWHAVIDELEDLGRPTVVHGEVVGGWHRPGKSTGSYGLVIYATDPPRQLTDHDATILTRSGRVAIEGEEHCQDYLFAIAGNKTAHQLVVRLDARHSHRITVNHGDQTLGWLTPAMSERYSPLLTGIRVAGLPTTCLATVRIGPKKLEVSLGLPTGSHLERALKELHVT